MAFVKLDTGILDSTLWIARDQREVFITALLMAEPREFSEPSRQIEIGSLDYTSFSAPPGWYGFVPAASFGIINRAGVDKEAGIEALRHLGEPEIESRSKEFEGRRMIRVNGGFLILNYMKYRDKDHTAAERQRRLRERRKAESVTRDVQDITRDATLPSRNITQADADADADAKKEQNPSRGKREGTKTALAKSRHAAFKEAVGKYWTYKNPGVEMPWGPAEGRNLEMWLRQSPNTSLEQFQEFLRHRARSEVNHAERPSRWIGNITSYAGGPLNQFKNPLNGGTHGHGDTNLAILADSLREDQASANRNGQLSAGDVGQTDILALLRPPGAGKR